MSDKAGGSNKTYTACQIHENTDDECLFLAFRNCVVQNFLKWRPGAKAYTFDTFYSREKRSANEYDRVIIDELDNTPAKWVSRFIRDVQYNDDIKINCFTCNNQCRPVEESQHYFDYHKSTELIHTLRGNYIVAKMTRNGRFDDKLIDELLYLLSNNKITDTFKRIDPSLDVNITLTNKKRLSINYDKVKDRTEGLVLGDITYQVGDKIICNHTGTVGYWKGEPCTVKVYNNTFFKITAVHDSYVELNDHYHVNNSRFRHKKLDEHEHPHFEHAFAFTIDKIQSITIDEPYNIWEMDHCHMYLERVITAVGRGTKKDYVHCKPTVRTFIRQQYSNPGSQTELIKDTVDHRYKKCEIYGIYYDGEPKYVGHTIRGMHERFDEHIKEAKGASSKFKEWYKTLEDKDNVSVHKLEDWSCNNRKAAECRERFWIEENGYEFELLNEYMKKKTAKSPQLNIRTDLLTEPDEYKFKDNPTKNELKLKMKDGKWVSKRYTKCGLDAAREYLISLHSKG